MLTPLKMGTVNLASVSVVELNAAKPETYLQETKQEEHLVDVEQDKIGTRVSLKTPTLKV